MNLPTSNPAAPANVVARVSTIQPTATGLGRANGFDFVSISRNSRHDFDLIGTPLPAGAPAPAGVPLAIQQSAEGERLLSLTPYMAGKEVPLATFTDALRRTQNRFSPGTLEVSGLAPDTELRLPFPPDPTDPI